MRTPHIVITYLDELPVEPFSEFTQDVEYEGLDLVSESRPNPGPVASLELLLGTAAFAYLAKPYFEGFLQEAGKDHYQIVKSALSRLSARLIGPNAPKDQLVYYVGKVAAPKPKYSMTFSIVGELDNGIKVKLLLESDLNDVQTEAAISAFLDFLYSTHNGTLDNSSVEGLADAKPVAMKLLIAFDHNEQSLKVIDPIPSHIRDRQKQQ
jgi:hypothetical protein